MGKSIEITKETLIEELRRIETRIEYKATSELDYFVMSKDMDPLYTLLGKLVYNELADND